VQLRLCAGALLVRRISFDWHLISVSAIRLFLLVGRSFTSSAWPPSRRLLNVYAVESYSSAAADAVTTDVDIVDVAGVVTADAGTAGDAATVVVPATHVVVPATPAVVPADIVVVPDATVVVHVSSVVTPASAVTPASVVAHATVVAPATVIASSAVVVVVPAIVVAPTIVIAPATAVVPAIVVVLTRSITPRVGSIPPAPLMHWCRHRLASRSRAVLR
jgi:hypothetical protein